jgi:ABC-type glycerol-3-phosphate transport system substrate-binding protein
MRLKRGLAGIVLAGLALGLGGCPEPGNTITFWVMPNTAPDRHTAWLERKKAEFLKSDGIVVNYEIVSWGDSWLKIERALAGGNGPDVVRRDRGFIKSTWRILADRILLSRPWRLPQFYRTGVSACRGSGKRRPSSAMTKYSGSSA